MVAGYGEVHPAPLLMARQAALDYMTKAGLPYDPPTKYVKVDPARATRIAAEYDKMKHDPNDPQVKAAYEAMSKEVIAQYQAVKDTGLKVEFIDFAKNGDPYAASPRLATEDVKNNNHLWVFPTADGFGSDVSFDASNNPLLADTGEKISGKPACVNDLFRCFAAGTLVRTRNGFVQIEKLAVGDEVLTHLGRYRKVTATMKRRHKGEVVDVLTSASHEPITVTTDHAFYVLNGNHDKRKKTVCTPYICHRKSSVTGKYTNQDKHHDFSWKQIGELQKGEWFPLTVDTEVVDIKSASVPKKNIPKYTTGFRSRGPIEFELSPEFLWMVGLYIAEGHATPKTNKITFSLHAKETGFVDRIKSFAESCGYGRSSRTGGVTVTDASANGIQVSINSKILNQWFPEWLGRGAKNKAIPQELLRLPAEKLIHLAQGIMDGDGRKRDGSIMQTSEILALQLVEVSRRLGFQATTNKVSDDGDENHSRAYTVHEVCSRAHSSRQKKYTWKILDADCRQFTALNRRDFSGYVYDIEVDEDHSFVVQNVPVHNCVHDYFGHIKEGNGFRADGEENAWRSHSAMFSERARGAMTSETRGQNSWVNYGPHGEANRTASSATTVFADQKTGLMPEWVTKEGAR